MKKKYDADIITIIILFLFVFGLLLFVRPKLLGWQAYGGIGPSGYVMPYCGDGICQTGAGESCENCEQDCGECPKRPIQPQPEPGVLKPIQPIQPIQLPWKQECPPCGDGICETTERMKRCICMQDCFPNIVIPTIKPIIKKCDNDCVCEAGETAECADCKSVYRIIEDDVKPVVKLVRPENASVEKKNKINFTFTVYDKGSAVSCFHPNPACCPSSYPFGRVDCDLYVNDKKVNIIKIMAFWRIADGITEHYITHTLENGNYTWQISCKDPATNEGFSEKWILEVEGEKIETQPPNLSIFYPEEGKNYGFADMLLHYKAEDESGLKECYYNLNSEGLVFYMPLDEGSGKEARDIASNFLAKVDTKWTKGKYGNALSFEEGSKAEVQWSQQLELVDDIPITVEAWIKPSNFPGLKAAIINKMAFTSCFDRKGWSLNMEEDGSFNAEIASEEKFRCKKVSSSTKAKIGEWYYVVFSYDGNKLKIYVNGKPENSVDARGYARKGKYEKEPLRIGYVATPGHNFFGTIDEIKIWRRVLDEQEITRNYIAKLPYKKSLPCEGKSYEGKENFFAASGSNTLGVYASDVHENFAFEFLKFNVVVDTTAPVVELLNPKDKQIVRSGFVKFICNAKDDKELSSIALNIWKEGKIYYSNIKSASGKETRENWNVLMEKGTYEWNCKAKDAAGNDPEKNFTLIVKDESLVLHLKFDEGSGSIAKDSSVYGNDGKIYGASWTEGKFGKALSFDGIDDYVEAKAPTASELFNGYTISAWIYPKKKEDVYAVIGQWGWHTGITLYESGVRAYFSNTIPKAFGTSVYNYPAHDRWYHVLTTYDRETSEITLWVDGKLISSAKVSGNISFSRPLIGYSYPTYKIPFYGLIDEVKIYARALSEEEIASEYGALPEAVCGNAVCEAGETAENCQEDCAKAVCGNNICEAGETAENCQEDCLALNFTINIFTGKDKAVVNITANKKADVFFKYGKMREEKKEIKREKNVTHVFEITGLEPSTTYEFNTRCCGSLCASIEGTFTTESADSRIEPTGSSGGIGSTIESGSSEISISSQTIQAIPEFLVDKEKIELKLFAKEKRTEKIKIINIGKTGLNINLFTDLKFLTFGEKSFFLNAGEEKEILLTFLAPDAEGTYEGKLLFSSTISQMLPVVVEVEKSEIEFSVSVKEKVVVPGSDVSARMFFSSEKEREGTLVYSIKNFDIVEEEKIIIKEKTEIERKTKVPKGAKPGSYSFTAKLIYEGTTLEEFDTFVVKKKFPFFVVFVAILIIAAFLLFLKKKKRRKEEKRKK